MDHFYSAFVLFSFQNFSFCVAWKKETPTDERYNFQASHSFKCNFSLANFINGLKARSSETKKRRMEEEDETVRKELCDGSQRCLWACQTLTKDLALCDTSLQNLHQTVPVGLYLWPRGSLSLWGAELWSVEGTPAQINWRISRRSGVSSASTHVWSCDHCVTFTLTFMHLADAFIRNYSRYTFFITSDLQIMVFLVFCEFMF